MGPFRVLQISIVVLMLFGSTWIVRAVGLTASPSGSSSTWLGSTAAMAGVLQQGDNGDNDDGDNDDNADNDDGDNDDGDNSGNTNTNDNEDDDDGGDDNDNDFDDNDNFDDFDLPPSSSSSLMLVTSSTLLASLLASCTVPSLRLRSASGAFLRMPRSPKYDANLS